MLYNNVELKKVISDEIKNILNSTLDNSQFATVDRSLVGEVGTTRRIKRYTKISDGSPIQNLAEGEGNDIALSVGYEAKEYRVGLYQGRTIWTDEQASEDPKSIDVQIKYLGDEYRNKMNNDVIRECYNISNFVPFDPEETFTTDVVIDALASLNLEAAEEPNFFALINPKMLANFRKAFKDELKYVEAFVRTGYVGTVFNVPVYVSKLVEDNNIIISNRDAITIFVKKELEIEQDREVNTRTNTYYARLINLVALTDDTKSVIVAPEIGVLEIGNVAVGTQKITGETFMKAKVNVDIFINDELVESVVADAAGEFTTVENYTLAEGDVIKVVAKARGFATVEKEVTVED